MINMLTLYKSEYSMQKLFLLHSKSSEQPVQNEVIHVFEF